ncbi:3-oxoadipate enol-lactonase [Aminivibrio pyruvatiphilus]|uniref:3-oxoadipate enol-lactonase n=2 Tax=Aminivibrio pyruvatiphilus TaxID=1005740 RepID=A0A4R8MEM7_9BACT|nr:3-oxoadipate enol-lactonase [Aminivibrio pyruvatiphilus]
MSGKFFDRGCSPVFFGEGIMTERRRRKEWNGIERPDGALIRWAAGEGERPLLLVPGFGGDGDCWGTAFPRQLFAREIAPVVYDPRGLGGSTMGSSQPSIALFAEDAAAVAEAAGAPLAVLGWSMGAFVAAELALARPELVSGVVLCCGSADHRRIAGERPALFRAILDRSAPLGEPAAALTEALLPASGKWSPTFRRAFRETLEASFAAHAEGIREQQTALAECPSLEGRLASFAMPVLVVEGSEDRLIPPGEGEILAGGIPGALLRILSGGHGLVYEAPGELAGAVAEFLGR